MVNQPTTITPHDSDEDVMRMLKLGLAVSYASTALETMDTFGEAFECGINCTFSSFRTRNPLPLPPPPLLHGCPSRCKEDSGCKSLSRPAVPRQNRQRQPYVIQERREEEARAIR